MLTINCGKISQDDVMSWCIGMRQFEQRDQFDFGYNWVKLNAEYGDKEVYTNNNHFLNGCGVAVKDEYLHCEEFKIVFYSEIEVIIFGLNQNGRFNINLPDGCFDNTVKELMELM